MWVCGCVCVCVCEQDLSLDNLEVLIYYKVQPTNQPTIPIPTSLEYFSVGLSDIHSVLLMDVFS